MIFIYNGREYCGETAVEVVRAVQRDTNYQSSDGSIRDFLIWTLKKMDDRLPGRELDVSQNISDEAIAYDFLFLLDSFGIGAFSDRREPEPSLGARSARQQRKLRRD